MSGEASKTYYILTQDRIWKPDSLTLRKSAGLKNPENGADYILITREAFLPSADPLIRFREEQGLRAVGVSVEDIFDEFGHGLFDPRAIKDFLSHAYHEWKKPAPTYILLIGDASTDYRDHWNHGKPNHLPVHLSTTDLGQTPDDNWYVCVEGDDPLPEMFVGRLPGENG